MDVSYDYESDALRTKLFPNNIEHKESDGLEWQLKIEKELSLQSNLQKIIFIWEFEWPELSRNRRVLGWKGTLMVYLWNKDRYMWTGPNEFDVEFFGSQCTIRKEIERNMDQCYSSDGTFWFKYGFELEPLLQRKTVLVVEGREIRVNKNILEKNSVYFADLFRDTNRSEFVIQNVNYHDMKQLMGLFHTIPVVPRVTSFPQLLELSDLFNLPSVRFVVEFHLLITDEIPLDQKIELAHRYKLDQLLGQCINSLKTPEDVKRLVENSNFNEAVKAKLLDRMMQFPE